MKEIMNFFPELLRINMVASIVILVILVARLILKRAPKVFSYALWTIVLIRLLIPVSLSSQLSVVPDISSANSAVINAALPELEFETLRDREQNYYEDQKDPSGEAPKIYISHSMEPIAYLSIVWLAGMACMVVYSSFSYWKIKKKIRISFPVQDNILIADAIKSPFVIGFIRPKIYLPCNLGEKEQSYIILHEKHHIRRGDHIIKALAFLALTIHWFNPLVWIAFVLACRDMEMSCDEAVIRKVGSHVRSDYSASLLTLATGRRIIAGTPLAFGEGDTKGRIHNLAKWKKPARWIVILSVVLCLILTVCLLTNPNTYVSATPETIMVSVESDGYTLTVLEATHSENMVSVKALVAVPEDGGSQQPMDVVLRSGSETLKCRSTSTSYDVEAMGAVQYIFLFESAEKPFVDKTFTLSVGGFRATDSADVYALTQPMEIRWEANTIGDCLSFSGKNDACEVTVEISSIAVRVKVYQTEEIYENINQVQSTLEIYDKKGKPVPMQYSGSGSIGGRQAEYTFVVFDTLDINNIGSVNFGNMTLA